MKVLFIVSEIILSEPLGVMQLSAICKQQGCATKLISIKQHNLLKTLADYLPDLVAYSTMSADAEMFIEIHQRILTWAKEHKHKLTIIMGGPHPTYFPEVLNTMQLEAICVGEGDRAITTIIERLKTGADLTNIPNVLSKGEKDFKRELIADLDALPFPDREVFYTAAPQYRSIGLRSVLTSRGCPYDCTYCFNHAFKEMFKGSGKILRRRSIDNVMQELHYIVRNFQPVKFIRFADDTFAHHVDDWLKEFLKRYKTEIGLPFYCLMRSNTLTEEMAQLLAEAGCKSISMSIETGNEKVRNEILKRNLSDAVIIQSFKNAKRFKINTHANTMLGIPGTTLKDDFASFEFVRKINPSLASFFIFCPYPKLELTNYAIKEGFFDNIYPEQLKFISKSVLTSYSEQEKEIQLRLSSLAGIFSTLPSFFVPLLKVLVRLNLNKLYFLIGWLYFLSGYYFKILPSIYPRNPLILLKVLIDNLRYGSVRKGK